MKLSDFNLKKNMIYLKYKYPWATYNSYKRLMNFIVVLSALFFATIYFVLSNNLVDSLYLFLTIGFLGYLFFYYYPTILKKSYVGKIEKSLPFFLIDLDMKLSIGQEFISALNDLSKRYDFLGDIFQKIISNYNKGITLQKSFREYSNIFNSQDFKRALTQIMNLYETGRISKEKGPLFELADEIINVQTTRTKLYSNKLVMISLLFIGMTAILPSLFLIFVNIGAFIFDLGITANQLLLIFVLGFPAIDVIIIVVILNMMPGFLK